MKDYYKILEIEFDADKQMIKKAFRRLALKYHPDRNKASNATAKFIEITEAHEVLYDDLKREQYNELYSIYYKEQNQFSEIDENLKTSKAQEWTDYGKKKASEYTSMSYDEFIDRIIDELKVGISYTPNIVFILICGFGAIVSLFTITQGTALAGLIIFIMYGTACYFLYDRAKKDYIAERRHKILNKYK